MKKIYFSPVVTVVKVETVGMIAGSPALSETSSDPSTPGLSRSDEDLFADE